MKRGGDAASRIALVAVILAAAACTSEPLTPTPLASSPSSVAPASPSPSTLPVAEGWRTIASWTAHIGSVVQTPFGWFALGYGSAPALAGHSWLWTSPDGASWSVADHTTLASAYTLWTVRPGLMAVGNTATVDFGTPLVWTSSDGTAWSRVEVVASPRNAVITSVVAWHGAVVAVGTRGPSETPGGDQGAVWTSADGVAWTEKGIGGEAVVAALALGDSLFLAGGAGGPSFVGRPTEPRRGAIWTSSDGVAFEQQAPSPALAGAYLRGAVEADGTLVLIGSFWDDETSQGEPAIWTSTDGISWDNRLHGPCCGSVMAAAWLGNEMVAAASDDATGRVVIYRSTDLLAWALDGVLSDVVSSPKAFVDSRTLGPLLLVDGADGSFLLAPPP